MFLAICVGKGTIYSNGGGGRFVSANLILLNRIFKKNVNLYMLHVNMLI